MRSARRNKLPVSPDLSLILTVYNRPQLVLTNTLAALARNDLTGCEILIIDDGSSEDYATIRDVFSELRVSWLRRATLEIRPQTYNLGGHNNPALVNNYALRQARGKNVVFISSDCLLPPAALTVARRHDLSGCVWVPRVVDLDSAHEYCGMQRLFPAQWMLACTRQAALECGGFDEKYLEGMGFEDPDFSWRVFLRTGKLVIDEAVTVWHQSHPAVYFSDGGEGYKRSEAYTREKHGGIPWDADWHKAKVASNVVGRQVIMRPKLVAVPA